MKPPRHLAIIMDGNGRWAKARGHNRIFGHVRGAKVAKTVIAECARMNVEYLTLFAFSTENWYRPKEEVAFLMLLLSRKLKRERSLLIKQNIRMAAIGDIGRLPPYVRAELLATIEATQHCTGMVLTFALSYGGRQEIVEMARVIAAKALSDGLDPADIDESVIAEAFPSSFLPDPDLIIRTSGEKRISNFFLWQSAYSELIFEDSTWPEFTVSRLHEILAFFSRRERRFGRTSDQLEAMR